MQKDRVSFSVARCDILKTIIPNCLYLKIVFTNPSACGFQGNAYFKGGKYEAAVECYSRGMEADSMNVLLPANRAMAFLKLEK